MRAELSAASRITYALLIVLETLTPAQRTALVLHDLIGTVFREVASVVGRSETAVRQLAAPARHHVAAMRMFGSHLSLARITVAYGTGYVVTRRSLPLGGAVITEVVLTFSLHWLGSRLGPALAAVAVYRLVGLLLISGPAILASRRVHLDVISA